MPTFRLDNFYQQFVISFIAEIMSKCLVLLLRVLLLLLLVVVAVLESS